MPANFPLPLSRITAVLDAMKAYQRAVVRANAPQSFDRTARLDDDARRTLRRHREASLAMTREFGITPLHAFLHGLNTEFIVAGEPWTVDDALWEGEVWPSLRTWADHGLELLLEGLKGDEEPRLIPTSELQVWQKQGESIGYKLLSQLWAFVRQHDLESVDDQVAGLSDRQLGILQVLWEASAFSQGERLSIEEVAELVDGPGTDRDCFKGPVAGLGSAGAGLLNSKTGRTGGIWLNEKGKQIARKLFER